MDNFIVITNPGKGRDGYMVSDRKIAGPRLALFNKKHGERTMHMIMWKHGK